MKLHNEELSNLYFTPFIIYYVYVCVILQFQHSWKVSCLHVYPIHSKKFGCPAVKNCESVVLGISL